VTILHAGIPKKSFDRKAIRPALDQISRCGCARRLEAKQDAHGFEDRSFALCILAYDA
jgi:hypothetical protein